MLSFITAALKVLPLVLQIISQFKQAADEKTQRGLGYDEAVKQALQEASDKLKIANDVEAAARKEHATKTGDDAFDTEFMRKDGA